jgi:hypothetical protein
LLPDDCLYALLEKAQRSKITVYSEYSSRRVSDPRGWIVHEEHGEAEEDGQRKADRLVTGDANDGSKGLEHGMLGAKVVYGEGKRMIEPMECLHGKRIEKRDLLLVSGK